MSCKISENIKLCSEEDLGKEFIERVIGKTPTYVCVIGNTETAKIPGVSAAGANPDITDTTPAADMELLHYGRCKCIEGVPVTPTGVPTPGIITMSATKMSKMPIFVMNAGVKVKPHVPYFELDGSPGEDIRTGKAVKNAERTFDRAVLAGKALAKISNYLVIGESIAGGTTTAYGVLTALGYDAKGKISSSMIDNPAALKENIVQEGLRNCGLSESILKKDPMMAVEALGDPMIVAAAGLAVGAAESVPVLLAGGTQMAAVLSVIKGMDDSVLDNIALGTTRWIVEDKSSDLIDLVSQIAKVPVLAADLNFSTSKYDGLNVYEKGLVKEGVGAGGSSIAAMLMSDGKINARNLLDEIEKNYVRLVSRR